MKKTNRKGFTIVELVIVIAVIAVLAAVLIPTFSGVIGNAKDAAAEQGANTAYTTYLSENAEENTIVDDFIFDGGDERFIVIKDGKVVKDANGDTVFYASLEAAQDAQFPDVEDNAATTDVDESVTYTATADASVADLYVVTAA